MKAPTQKPAQMNFGSDAVIRMSIFLPEKEPVERIIRIKNFLGNSLGSQRDPETFIKSIKDTLRAKFGDIIE